MSEKIDIQYTCFGCVFLHKEELTSSWKCLKYNENLTVADSGIPKEQVKPFPYCKCRYYFRNRYKRMQCFGLDPGLTY